jgi:hypothetical protein
VIFPGDLGPHGVRNETGFVRVVMELVFILCARCFVSAEFDAWMHHDFADPHLACVVLR